jgi:non-specific serine/threonine protein kinase
MGIMSLPVALTPLVGRRAETAAIARILQEPATRLLTLTGPGGTGKTRLALAVAGDVAVPDGANFVDLAAIVEPEHLPGAIAAAVGLRESPSQALPERLTEHLRGLDGLLVLDNLEQLLPEAARQVAALLRSCPRLKILATSRAALHVSGEREYPVPPLTLPDPLQLPTADALAGVESVRLFVERAQAVRPEFALTAANAAAVCGICTRLDGLPLAIELAAARIKTLPPEELLVRLERRLPLLTGGPVDAPDRQRTLRDTVAWSYDLLPSTEQRLFRRLAVFSGGFSLEAAEAVCGDDTEPGSASEVLDGLESLVDRSLVRQAESAPGEPRYRMLETIREFAVDHLGDSGEERDLRDRHAAWFLDRSEQLWTALVHGPVRVAWLNRAEAEHDNVRAAMRWLDEERDLERLARFVGALWPFWRFRNHFTELRTWVIRCLPERDQLPLPWRARFLFAATEDAVTEEVGEVTSAHLGDELLAAYQALGDAWGIACAVYHQGQEAHHAGRFDDAYDLHRQSLEIFEQEGARDWVAITVLRLGEDAFAARDFEHASERFEQSLELHRALEDPWGIGIACNWLALLALQRKDHSAAATWLTGALPSLREVGDADGLLHWIATAAMLAASAGDVGSAVRLFGAHAALTNRYGVRVRQPRAGMYEDALDALRRRLGGSVFQSEWSTSQTLNLERAIEVAEAVIARAAAAPKPPAEASSGLTSREQEILRLIVKGRSDREIADELFISVRTVQTHVANLLAKLGVHNRAEAAGVAVERKLV